MRHGRTIRWAARGSRRWLLSARESRQWMEDNRVGQLGRAIRQATRSGVETRRRVLIARAKSLLKGHRLPPGNFFQLEPLLASDPKALALKAAKAGPILTGIWGDKVAIFVTRVRAIRVVSGTTTAIPERRSMPYRTSTALPSICTTGARGMAASQS